MNPALVLGTALLAVALQAGGCTSGRATCDPAARPRCEVSFGPCEPVPAACAKVPPGTSHAWVEIDALPTPAAIYVDGEYVGRTPLGRFLWFSSNTRAVTVSAEPLYPGQARQEQRLRVPHLPRRLTFFMNNPAAVNEPEESERPQPVGPRGSDAGAAGREPGSSAATPGGCLLPRDPGIYSRTNAVAADS